MPEEKNWSTYDIQEHGSGPSGPYYRMSLPKGWVERNTDGDQVQQKAVDDHIVVRPRRDRDGVPGQLLEIPEIFSDMNEAAQVGYLSNVLQSYVIGGVEEVEIGFPPEANESLRIRVSDALMDLQWGDQLVWKRADSTFQINGGVAFRNYVDEVVEFMDRFLIRPVNRGRDSFGDNLAKIESRERDIDKMWTLATRDFFADVLRFEISDLSFAVGKLYVGKYLERAADLTKDCVERLASLDLPEETMASLLDRLDGVLSEPVPLHSHLRDVASASYGGNIEPTYYHEGCVTDLQERTRAIDRLGDDSNVLDGADRRALLAVGRLLSKVEELVRLGRSIAHAGLVSASISEPIQSGSTR